MIYLFFLLLLGFLLIHFVLPYLVIVPHRVTQQHLLQELPKGILPSDFGLDYERVTIQTVDRLQLKGYLVKSKMVDILGTVIVLHGIGSCKEYQFIVSTALAQQGYQSFIYDARAHGESQGRYCTFGYLEKRDVSTIIDFLEKEKSVRRIGIWGTSYGGAVALQALEQDPRIKSGVILSTFADLAQIVHDYKKKQINIGIRLLSRWLLTRAGEIANFDPQKIKPAESAKHIHQPVFIAHGDVDVNIDVRYGKQIFRNLASKFKELVIVKGAGHDNLFVIGGEKFEQEVFQFLKKHLH